MTGQRHTRPKAIIRFALIVAYLALFVTQLSGRYYFCASYPFYSAAQGQGAAWGKTPSKGTSSLSQVRGALTPDSQNIRVLSLDKRFDGKHVYALLSPLIAAILPLPAPRIWRQERPASLPHILRPIPQQRGPPFRA
ncbi:MAG TPA: hypothetical protein VL978_06905 [Puia sp.]|nr:hypothetical protein [Puia sp.]